MHEKCYYQVKYGSIYPKDSDCFLQEPIAMLLDLDTGTLLKVGDEQWVRQYFDTMVYKYYEYYKNDSEKATELVKDLKVITFNIKHEDLGFKPDNYVLDVDDVCTLINYFMNSIGEKLMNKVLNMNETELINEIHRLQEIGF